MGIELRHTDKIGSILWLLLAGIVFLLSDTFPTGPDETGPAFYPRVIAGLIALFALLQFVRSVYTERRSHEITLPTTKRVLGVLLLVIGYVFLLPWLGFVTATAAFLAVGTRYSGAASSLRIGGVAIGLTLLLYYTFAVFLRIPLPESPLYPVARLLPTVLAGVGL